MFFDYVGIKQFRKNARDRETFRAIDLPIRSPFKILLNSNGLFINQIKTTSFSIAFEVNQSVHIVTFSIYMLHIYKVIRCISVGH